MMSIRLFLAVLFSLFFSDCICFLISLGIIPSVDPLKYITPDIIGAYTVNSIENALWSTILPVDQQDAVAIFVSEGVSGFLGGVAAKGISIIDGNKNNRESGLVSAELSGAYFGVAGAFRSLAQIAGFSSFFVNIIALTFAALVSEFIKIRSRSIEPLRTRVGNGPTMYELMKFKQPNMNDLMKYQRNKDLKASALSSVPTPMSPGMPPMMGPVSPIEIYADLTKWFFIYFLNPQNPATRLEDSVLIGVVAGLLSQLVREQKDRELEEQVAIYSKESFIAANRPNTNTLRRERLSKRPPPKPTYKRPDFVATRLARSSLECAVQLLTYEAARSYVMEVGPYFKSIAETFP